MIGLTICCCLLVLIPVQCDMQCKGLESCINPHGKDISTSFSLPSESKSQAHLFTAIQEVRANDEIPVEKETSITDSVQFENYCEQEPNAPGKQFVWFRNETTILVLWQPPNPSGNYTHYKVSIEPPEALNNVLWIQKENDPPGPSQGKFTALVPGRAYSISIQTVCGNKTSPPSSELYRTVPLRPTNVTIDEESITENSFKVMWRAPLKTTDFDKYLVSVADAQILVPRSTGNDSWLQFQDKLEAGKTYTVVVKTQSGKVTSWPASVDVTLKPLPVKDLSAYMDSKTGAYNISWSADEKSIQDEFKISYRELDSINGDLNEVKIEQMSLLLESLLPERNYSVSVQAVSKLMEPEMSMVYIVPQSLVGQNSKEDSQF